MAAAPESRLLIDGVLTEARSGRTFPNVNPATEEVVGEVADGGVEDMDAAIAAARRAFDETDWSTDREFRKRVLHQLVDALDRHKDDLRPHIVAEVGCPVMLTHAVQLDSCIPDMRWDIDAIDRIEWESELGVHEFMGMRSNRLVLREPVGVVGAITPWNFPFMLNVSKLAPALAAGNTVVLKPAPDTPWSATMIGRIIAEETDIPPGVVNIVASGDKAAVGEVLTGDPRVDMISFTGSTGVGKRIMARGAETVKKVFLELGGKSANIILDDADLDGVAMGGMMICMHAGQGCAITTRMLLPESRYDEAVEKLAGAFAMVPYGDPTDMSNLMGPLVNRTQYERVLGMIDRAKADGARCLVGGGPATQFERGFFVQPTLFVDVDPDSELAQDEVFGPVLAVIKYRDDDDAVRIANSSRYGLSGAVSSASLDRALGVARRIRTGTVSVNGGAWFGPDSPFGGYKESGVGREHGIAGFEEYLETKTVGLPAT
jgi:aldehyde dehydrogenase (NAD+)